MFDYFPQSRGKRDYDRRTLFQPAKVEIYFWWLMGNADFSLTLLAVGDFLDILDFLDFLEILEILGFLDFLDFLGHPAGSNS